MRGAETSDYIRLTEQPQAQTWDIPARHTRFLILAEPGVLPNLASMFLAGMTRRLADDWLAAHGHRVLVAETFCDPARFAGTMYRAAGWQGLGKTKGYARMNGQYTDPHGQPKEILACRLRPDACRILSDPQPLPTLTATSA